MNRGKLNFGGAELEVERSRLIGPGGAVHIEPRVIEVAATLARNANEVVSRDALIAEVWGNYPGADRSLTTAVSKLRQYLKQVGGDPGAIETVPKRGYRARVAGPQPVAAPTPDSPGLAVLPFRNLGGNAEDNYLCEGLAEDLLNALGHGSGLRLAARASAFILVRRKHSLPEIGRRLDVAYALDGSLRRQSGRIRLSVTLATTAEQTQVWSGEFECDSNDLETLPRRVARTVVTEALGRSAIELPPSTGLRDAARSADAYNAFLKGRYFWYRENTNPGKALEQFHRAVELAPEFALPYAGLVDCYCAYGVWQIIPQPEAREKALDFAEQAMTIAPELADVQFSHGYAQFYARWRWKAAERAFRRTLDQSPRHIMGHSFLMLLYAVLHRDKEVEQLGERLVEIDPVSPWCWWMRCLCTYYLRDFERALRYADESLELEPGTPPPLFVAASSLAHLGRLGNALERTRELERAGGELDLFLAIASSIYALCGARADSDRTLSELRKRNHDHGVNPMVFSFLHAVRGDEDKAIASLLAMMEQSNMATFYISREPLVDPVRTRPEFVQVLKALGLTPPARPLRVVR